jgi:hypothetical protein
VAAGSGALTNGRRIKEQPDTHDTETHRENPSDVHMAKFIFLQRECGSWSQRTGRTDRTSQHR